MVDFKALQTFVDVATLSSFQGAAKKLNTTQPAISQRIAQLETTLSAKLFLRRHRAIHLTPVGRELLGYAEKLLRLRGDMLLAITEKAALRGVLRLSVPGGAQLATVQLCDGLRRQPHDQIAAPPIQYRRSGGLADHYVFAENAALPRGPRPLQ